MERQRSGWIDIPLCGPTYAEQNAAAFQNDAGPEKEAQKEGLHFLLDKNYNPWQQWFEKTGVRPLDIEVA